MTRFLGDTIFWLGAILGYVTGWRLETPREYGDRYVRVQTQFSPPPRRRKR